jgi:hypothetical protein
MKSFRIPLVLSLVALAAPALMAQNQMQQAPPGTVNYVEGAVALDGQHISTSDVGSKVLQPGQVISTTNGRAEVLLTPGVFLRLGHNSSVQMVNPDLLKTQVRITNGRASVEVDSLYKQNRLEIAEDGVVARIEKRGLYEFNSNDGLVRTYEGIARIYANGGRTVKVGTSHEANLPPAPAAGSDTPVAMQMIRVQHFDRKRAEESDSLIAWSRLRSHYLSQANTQLAYEYAGYPGFVPGWYWNPWGMGYTWLPGNGIFWNPFGWGFYSPIWMNYNYPYYNSYNYGVATNTNGNRITPARNGANPGWNGSPRTGFQGGPVRSFGPSGPVSTGGSFGGGAGVGRGGGVNLGGAGFGGGHVGTVSPGGGGHGH